RTMGIWERPPGHFLDSLRDEFDFEPPREHGFDAVAAVKAFRDGKAKVFFGMGGNFVSAMSDTAVTEDALRQAELTVHVSTKPNRSHVVTGREALILPALGRSEKDLTGGRPQRVTVEDSVCSVHASQGPLAPASPHLRSEVDIVCSMALATLGEQHGIPWQAFRDDYTEVRRRIARVVPGCAGYDEKVDQPGGFVLPHPPRDTRTFPTDKDKAIFTVSPTEVLHVPEGRLLLQTMRSHDQFNTTIYGLDDRYRGIKNGRRVVFLNPDDIVALGLEEGQMVDIVSEWEDGSERCAPKFRVVSYDTPRGCTGAYYPETNALVPLDSKAEGSNQPAFKSVVVRLEPHDAERPARGRVEMEEPEERSAEGRGDEAKRHVEPGHLS
ncbi:MAG: molybdopterin dinucleotide binding domain-containing protein, partial [Nocardioides sp.]